MPVPFMLDGKLLPWLASATHIGHELHESGSMDLYTKMKKAEFIGKSTEIRETFNFASRVEVLKAVKLFAGDLYGAMLWDFQGDLAEQDWILEKKCFNGGEGACLHCDS